VVDAADGVEALAILQNQVPNIVITDLMLPRLSGIELVAEVKKLHPELPVVVLSAKFEPEKELAPEQVAMVKAFLPKPIDAEELFQKIKQELELVAPPY
jgi:CheY-like chemotaxis protein